MKSLFLAVSVLIITSIKMSGQNFPTAWEDLSTPDFALAVEKSEGVCLLPMGAIEKHSQHLPLSTDISIAREICRRAAANEYCIIFPYFYAGEILYANHQPGTIAYSPELLLKLLDETCKEIARNGIKKIVIVNCHGGNSSFLAYFSQIQNASPRDYAVYLASPSVPPDFQEKITPLRKNTIGGHADEVETSYMLAIRPELVKMERVSIESGVSLNRLQHLPNNITTGIKWYADHPNCYSGDGKYASSTLGELFFEGRSRNLVELIKAIKADTITIQLQNEFFQKSLTPLNTKE